MSELSGETVENVNPGSIQPRLLKQNLSEQEKGICIFNNLHWGLLGTLQYEQMLTAVGNSDLVSSLGLTERNSSVGSYGMN